VNRQVCARWRWLARHVMPLVGAMVVAVAGLLVSAPAAWASGNDVGANLSSLLEKYATELYGGIVAVVSLIFLLNRRYTELAIFLLAAIVVAWMVFAPGEIGSAAQAIGKSIFG